MKKDTKVRKSKKKNEKRFSWVIRAAERRALPKQPAGDCNCK